MERKYVLAFLVIVTLFAVSTIQIGGLRVPNGHTSIGEGDMQIAKSISEIPTNAILRENKKQWNPDIRKTLHTIAWETEDDGIIESSFHAETGAIVHHIDTTEKSAWSYVANLQEAKVLAIGTAFEFIESLEQQDVFEMPGSAVFEGLLKGTTGWVFSWKNEHEGVPVKGDMIEIEVNPSGSDVVSFYHNWHDVTASAIPKHGISSTLKHFGVSLMGNSLFRYSLEFVPLEKETHLCWKLDFGNMFSWVDSTTLSVIDVSGYMASLNCDAYAIDPGAQETYDCGKSVYLRFRSALVYQNRKCAHYYEGEYRANELNRMDRESIYFHIGHGYITEVGSQNHSTLFTNETYQYDDQYYDLLDHDYDIFPSQIRSEDLSSMKLAFPCACWSAADDWHGDHSWNRWEINRDNWVTVHDSITDAFMDAGVDCVLGWDEPVGKTVAREFATYFFDKLCNGYSASSSYSYARSKVDTRNKVDGEYAEIDRMYGYGGITFEIDDTPGSDFSSAENLGSASGADNPDPFIRQDEGLWYEDVDFFKFTVEDYSYWVDIIVAPIDDDYEGLDVIFKVYDSSHNLIKYKNSNGKGGTEMYSFIAGPETHYIRVYFNEGTNNENHGGAYDISVQIYS
ncbi:MAG: hypothetical protein GF309_13210 [Candidatus Lokiarchaeota archaeon]|nr:hypothetical protein [Candidatus Lokiarchaeota archaeon]